MKNIIIFEDSKTSLLKPFSITHATFEIQSGLKTNLERIMDIYGPNYKYILLVRSEIESLIKNRYPELEVNPKFLDDGKYINGKYLLKDYINLENFPNHVNNEDLVIENLFLIENLWDSIFYFNEIFKYDFKETEFTFKKYKNNENILVADSSNIKEGVILDQSNGPIVIGENVTIDIGALLQGPLLINDNSYLAPGAKIRSGTMIGENCKVGGEVSNSIFYKNSNKVHDGFLGHSFIGEWVNIGAGTNNSNLKNNYSTIKFNHGTGEYDTGKQFLGSMIGDYSTIGISTMLNSGTYIGIGCNVFGAGFQNKYIPSFSWGKENSIYNIEKLIKTINRMQKRRKTSLSTIEADFLKKIYKK